MVNHVTYQRGALQVSSLIEMFRSSNIDGVDVTLDLSSVGSCFGTTILDDNGVTMLVLDELNVQFGLVSPNIRVGLSQEELFMAAVTNDRGRTSLDDRDDAPKAFATKLGVDGPLMYYSDPTCTGRPTQDTFAVARPGTEDTIWWKKGFAKFDAAKFDALLPRVIDHLNRRAATLYVPNRTGL